MVFLYVFKPFGMSSLAAGYRFYLAVGYGVTCFMVLLAGLTILPRLFPRIFREESWTVGRRIFWQLWLVFSVGVGNFFFNAVWHLLQGSPRVGLGSFLYFQMITLLIAVLPLVILNLIIHNFSLRRNLELSRETSTQLKIRSSATEPVPDDNSCVIFGVESGKERYEVNPDEILYIASEGNYARIVFTGDQGKPTLIRSSLTRIENQLHEYPYLLRCHRAYMVNIRKVREVTGNAQGLRLHMQGVGETLPVARSYVKRFRARLKTL